MFRFSDDDVIGPMGSSPHQINNPEYSQGSALTTGNIQHHNNNMDPNIYGQQNDVNYGDYPDVTDDYPQQNTFQVL